MERRSPRGDPLRRAQQEQGDTDGDTHALHESHVSIEKRDRREMEREGRRKEDYAEG